MIENRDEIFMENATNKTLINLNILYAISRKISQRLNN